MSLTGTRILVPPARPEANPLAELLRAQGAQTLYFPQLQPRYPSTWDSLDGALRQRDSFDWIVFAGSNSVHHWVERAGELGLGDALPAGVRLAAIGDSAARALRTDGRIPDHQPGRHVAGAVAPGLSVTPGNHVLLVRVAGASEALPRALSAMGARVHTADGYHMAIRATSRDVRQLVSRGIDVIALTNPTAVRHLRQGAQLAGADLQQLAAGTLVAAAGETTARAARSCGLEPEVVGQGQLSTLTTQIVHWWDRRPWDHQDPEQQAATFIQGWQAADEHERAAIRPTGAKLIDRLRTGARDLAYSKATEFSPKIKQYEQLAAQIKELLS